MAKQFRPWFLERYDPVAAGSIDGTDSRPHDHAVVRALGATYEATHAKGEPFSTLFIGRLPPSTLQEELDGLVAPFGPVRAARIVRNLVTGESRGYAFVEFERQDDCRAAYRALAHAELGGSRLIVDYERARVMDGWVPRRLGGGIGGKKESGQLRFGGRARPFREPANTRAADIEPRSRRDDCWYRAALETARETEDRKAAAGPQSVDGDT